MRNGLYNTIGLLGVLLVTSACSKGGNLTLEPGARKIASKGSPFVQVNQGGKALIYEQGLTPSTATTGVHGWVSVQAVSSTQLSSASGHKAVINKVSAKK